MAKELKWKGLTEEQLKDIDMNKFMELIPARRRRSLKRGHTDDQKALLKKIEKNEINLKKNEYLYGSGNAIQIIKKAIIDNLKNKNISPQEFKREFMKISRKIHNVNRIIWNQQMT